MAVGAAVAWPATEALLCSLIGIIPSAEAALLAARRAAASSSHGSHGHGSRKPSLTGLVVNGTLPSTISPQRAPSHEGSLPASHLVDVVDLSIACARGESRRARLLATAVGQSTRPLQTWASAGVSLLGGPGPTREHVEAALLETLQQGMLAWAPLLSHRLVELALRDGDSQSATFWTRELRELAPSFGTPWCSILAARAEAAALDRIDAAWEALELATRHGMDIEALLARLELGRLGGPEQEAVTAFTQLRDLGAETWQRRALAVLRDRRLPIPRSPRRPSRSATTLTEIELQLSVRAAEGATNGELAAIFALSRRTVEARLSDAYRKLGCRSRLDLAAALRERGLAG